VSYLLDTHTLIWSILDVNRIPVKTRNLIRDAHNPIFVSVISFWEFSIKHSLGKLKSVGLKPEDLPAIVLDYKFSILALKPDEVASAHRLPWVETHKDPFDRIIIWQAIKNNLPLISKDGRLTDYERYGLKLIW
jgi:PIN domain nuclease of toxin-antitoxin system